MVKDSPSEQDVMMDNALDGLEGKNSVIVSKGKIR